MMDVRPINSEADYAWALNQIEPYFETEPATGSAEADRFDVLAVLIQNYEQGRHEIPTADPVAVLQFAINTLGRSQAELGRVLGSRSRASEILRRQRPLTLDMIRSISEAWNLPLEALAAPYDLTRQRA